MGATRQLEETELQGLAAMAAAVAEHDSPEVILQHALDAIVAATGAAGARVLLTDERTHEPLRWIGRGEAPPAEANPSPDLPVPTNGQALLWPTSRGRVPSPGNGSHPAPGAVQAPIRTRGRQLGMLEVYGGTVVPGGDPGSFLTLAASQLVPVLEWLRLLHTSERRERETQVLYRIGTEVTALVDLQQILQYLVEQARVLLEGEMAVLCLWDAQGSEMSVGATAGPSDAFCFDVIKNGGREIEPTEKTPRWFTCQVVQPSFRRYHLSALLKAGERVIGDLCVGTKTPRVFSSDDLALLNGLASQATIAIINARLHRRVQELAVLEERDRIGRDLHDGIIQSIYGVSLNLDDCLDVMDEDAAQAKERIEGTIVSLNDVIKDIRNYILDLRPQIFQGKDLRQGITDLVREFQANTLINTQLVIGDGTAGDFPQDRAVNLLQITREALSNAAKHARATRVKVRLHTVGDRLTLSIEDNGQGFDAHQARTGEGQGMRNMSDRARALGGRLSIQSSPGRGTKLTLDLPLADRSKREMRAGEEVGL